MPEKMYMLQPSIFTAIGSMVFLIGSLGPGIAQSINVNVGFVATVKMERKIGSVIAANPAVAQARIAADGKVMAISADRQE